MTASLGWFVVSVNTEIFDSNEVAALEKSAVGGDFLLQLERVGARGGWQAGEAECASVQLKFEGLPGFQRRFGVAGEAEQHFGRLAAGGENVAQPGQLAHDGGQVEGFDDAQMGVGGVAFFADGAAHAGADGDAARREKGADALGIEALFALKKIVP